MRSFVYYTSASCITSAREMFLAQAVHALNAAVPCSLLEVTRTQGPSRRSCHITTGNEMVMPLLSATGWTVRESNLGGGARFSAPVQTRPWGPPGLLYNGYRVSLPGVKRPGRGVDHPPPSSVEVNERVELYLYSPTGSSWSILG